MEVNFSENSWDKEAFLQVCSLRTPDDAVFVQEAQCIVNDKRRLERGSKNYHYISLLTKESYTGACELRTVCDFEEFGAPLLVLTDDLIKDPENRPAYGHHFEIVAYEKGFNIWELNGADRPVKAAFETFEVPAGSVLELKAQIDPEQETITVALCGKTFTEHVARLPKTYHAGITACEGVNHFYRFTVSPLEKE